ncbi:unnamed protein product, partial [Ectocarpus fasciculatus]
RSRLRKRGLFCDLCRAAAFASHTDSTPIPAPRQKHSTHSYKTKTPNIMGHDHSKPVKAIVGVLALASAASAFVAPGAAARGLTQQTTRTSATVVFGNGKYDGKLWDDAAKDDVKSMYDPSQPWSDTNFDPYVKDAAGNKCDSSGYYPGETM